MIREQKMQIALGLPIWVEGFKDGQPRKAYPITLENLMDANIYLSSFDNENLYENFKDQNATLFMARFFSLVFKVDDEKELLKLLENIDSENFSEIVKDIKFISGIDDKPKDENLNTFTGNSAKGMDWNVAINSIPLYTSTSISEIKDMTLTQFNKTLELIGKKISYNYKVSTLGLVKEPSKHIKDSDHPLYSEQEAVATKLTLKDIAGFMQ